MIALIQAVTLSIFMYLEKCGKKYNPFAHFENITSAICTFGGDGVEADQEKSKTD